MANTVLLQLPDAAASAIRDGLLPTGGDNPSNPAHALWATVQNAIGLGEQTGLDPVSGLSVTSFIPATAAGNATVNQYPALSACWFAWQIVNVSDQQTPLGDLVGMRDKAIASFTLNDTAAAQFGNAYVKYVSEFAAARDAWIADYPATQAWVTNQQAYQAAFARGTTQLGTNVVPTEYIHEGPTTLPDGNVFAVVFDPRNPSSSPDSMQVIWYQGPLWKQTVADGSYGQIIVNRSLYNVPTPGTGSWYIAGWAHEYFNPPTGWVNDGFVLISPRAAASLMIQSSNQVIELVAANPSTLPVVAPPPPSGVTIPAATQPVLLAPATATVDPTAATQTNLGGGISPTAVAPAVSAVPAAPAVSGFVVIAAIVVGGAVIYMLTKGE